MRRLLIGSIAPPPSRTPRLMFCAPFDGGIARPTKLDATANTCGLRTQEAAASPISLIALHACGARLLPAALGERRVGRNCHDGNCDSQQSKQFHERFPMHSNYLAQRGPPCDGA